MNRRQDASKALQQLKNMKLHGSVIKVIIYFELKLY